MNYEILPTVFASGIGKTGLTALINDRDTSLTVPWQVSNTTTPQNPKNIEWVVESDNGTSYKVTVPLQITYNSATGKSTAAYAQGTYTITALQNGGS